MKSVSKKSQVQVNDVVDLGQLILKFSRVERQIFHEDGIRPETDSDHTVMLSVIACSVASIIRPDLDLGKIAQYATIHDLVEVYAGDTPTIRINAKQRANKASKEAKALTRIEKEFGQSFPWLIKTMKNYEELDEIEARFVKAVDKMMPNITHMLNNGAVIESIGMSKPELLRLYASQIEDMKKYCYDLPEVIELKQKMNQAFIKLMYP